VLGIEPTASRPSSVLHWYFNESSDLLMETVDGSSADQSPRLLVNWHSPKDPSPNESETGVIASEVKVAHPVVITVRTAISSIFMASILACRASARSAVLEYRHGLWADSRSASVTRFTANRVRFGSLADLSTNISLMSASEGKADVPSWSIL